LETEGEDEETANGDSTGAGDGFLQDVPLDRASTRF
jgi:hypothetical protein